MSLDGQGGGVRGTQLCNIEIMYQLYVSLSLYEATNRMVGIDEAISRGIEWQCGVWISEQVEANDINQLCSVGVGYIKDCSCLFHLSSAYYR